jgi:Mn2+/Fe2+ NRAMP family transporter
MAGMAAEKKAKPNFVRRDFLNINPIKALFWTGVINGVVAPFLVVEIVICASDPKLIEGRPSSCLSRIAVGIITRMMFGTASAMFAL